MRVKEVHYDITNALIFFMSEDENKQGAFITGYTQSLENSRAVFSYFCNAGEALTHAYVPKEKFFYSHIQIDTSAPERLIKYLKRKGYTIEVEGNFITILFPDEIDILAIKRLTTVWFKYATEEDSFIYYSIGEREDD